MSLIQFSTLDEVNQLGQTRSQILKPDEHLLILKTNADPKSHKKLFPQPRFNKKDKNSRSLILKNSSQNEPIIQMMNKDLLKNYSGLSIINSIVPSNESVTQVD